MLTIKNISKKTKKIKKRLCLFFEYDIIFNMRNYFEKFNLNLSEKQEENFENYYKILIEYNNKFNLTAITEKEEVIIKHFVDSLLNVDKVVGKMFIDIGSGGGFPSIPLKIYKKDIMLTMVEATGKKCEFLKTVVDKLELKNCFVINERAEILAKNSEYREKYDICTARAVARLNTLCEYCMPFVKVGGKFVAYKGDASEEIKESENAIKTLGGKLISVDEFDLMGAKRQIIIIQKEKPTPITYPRGNGKERKKPL